MIERFANHRSRQRHVTLSQTHQCEAWLWFPPCLVGREESLFGPLDVSHTEADPAKFGERPPELTPQVRAQLLTGLERFSLGLDAGPTQPEDLGTVNAAPSVDASDR